MQVLCMFKCVFVCVCLWFNNNHLFFLLRKRVEFDSISALQSHLLFDCNEREEKRLKRKALLGACFDLPGVLLDSFDRVGRHVVPERASRITHNVSISGKGGSRDVDLLSAMGITHVLNCAAELAPDAQLQALYGELGISWIHLRLCDDENDKLEDCFTQCNTFIREAEMAGGVVLVHCNLGQSRSPAIVIASLIALHGFTLRDAWLLVKKQRPFVYPQAIFFKALMR